MGHGIWMLLLLQLSLWLVGHYWPAALVSIFSASHITWKTQADQTSIGDFADLLMSYHLIRKADKIDGGLPMKIRARMVSNVMLDFAIGFIPVLGDFADAFHRANTKNAWLLDAYLEEKSKAIHNKTIVDAETKEKVAMPDELIPKPEDLEQGVA